MSPRTFGRILGIALAALAVIVSLFLAGPMVLLVAVAFIAGASLFIWLVFAFCDMLILNEWPWPFKGRR